jgi:transcription elongation factor Elf1
MNNEQKTVFLKCKKCGHGHFAVSREEAQRQVDEFNQYFDSLTKEDQEKNYGGNKSSIDSYEKCFRCSAKYTESEECKEEDIPLGVTIQPLIHE